jgi:hypothetical protein
MDAIAIGVGPPGVRAEIPSADHEVTRRVLSQIIDHARVAA